MYVRAKRDEEADYAELSHWLTHERVLDWYEGRDQAYPLEREIE